MSQLIVNIEQKRISLAGQTSADQTGPRYSLFFQYTLIHDLAHNVFGFLLEVTIIIIYFKS